MSYFGISTKENAAITAAYQSESDPEDKIENLLSQYINENAGLDNMDLEEVYIKIKNRIVGANLFHLFLIGYHNVNENERKLCDYTTENGDTIDLTVYSVCEEIMHTLFRDYKERQELSERAPNFQLYYTEDSE